MAAVVAKAIAYGVTAVKGITALQFVAGAVMAAGINYLKKGLDAAQTDEIKGLTLTSRSPAGARKIIYGKVRVGGHLVFSGSAGEDNFKLIQVVALADQTRKSGSAPNKAITDVEDIYFNGERVATYDYNTNGFVLTDQKYSGYFFLDSFDGSQTTASPIASGSDDWSSTSILKGVGYVAMSFWYDQDVYVDGLPNVSFFVKGRPVYDPRSNSHSESDPTTWEYRENPALSLLDYMCDPVYGLGLSYSDFDSTSFIETANYCDDSVAYKTGDGSQSNTTAYSRRYIIGGQINTENSIRSNIEDILSSMAGKLSYSNGKYFLESSKPKVAESTIVDEGMMVGAISLVTKSSRQNQYNTVQGRFASSDNNYQESSYPTQTNSTYVSDDGEELILDLDLPLTTQNHIAQRIAKYTLNRSRNQTVINLRLSIEAMKFKVGDLINVKYEKFGYNTKGFVIQSFRLKPDVNAGMFVEVEAIEYDPSDVVYSVLDQIVFQQDLIASQYDPLGISAPTSIAAYFATEVDNEDNLTPKINITIDDDPSAFITHYQLYIYRLPEENATGHEQYIDDGIEFTLTKDFGLRKGHAIDVVDRRTGFYRIACQSVNTSGVYSSVVTSDFEIEEEHREIVAPSDNPSVIVIQQTEAIDPVVEISDAVIEEAKGSPPQANDTIIVQQVDSAGAVVDAETRKWKRGIILTRNDDFATSGFFVGYNDEVFIDIWCRAIGAPTGGVWSKVLTDNTITANTQSLHDRSTTTMYSTASELDTLKGHYVTNYSIPLYTNPTGGTQKLVYTDDYVDELKAEIVNNGVLFRIKLNNNFVIDQYRDVARSTYRFEYDPQQPVNTGQFIRITGNYFVELLNN